LPEEVLLAALLCGSRVSSFGAPGHQSIALPHTPGRSARYSERCSPGGTERNDQRSGATSSHCDPRHAADAGRQEHVALTFADVNWMSRACWPKGARTRPARRNWAWMKNTRPS